MPGTAPIRVTLPPSAIEVAKAAIVAFSAKDWPAVRDALAPDVAYDEVPTQCRVRGVDDVVSCWQGWSTALPDLAATFDHVYTIGDTVVLELTWRGTHLGTLDLGDRSVHATHRPVVLRACQIVQVSADGKSRAIRQYFDLATLMQQIGLTR
jgi:steroid delta-isomerase-like uncharacterized protein